ncbi:MAG: tRNA (N(6)-L-threonylcarbamoyladenosine(37)-C(2))-methylthiotransferase MtaB [Anaerolineae bacterium]|nr:tRNA (N(6)-L-threonylcarbamoyladenosine(37)-C(2))-methylthiotransferase MtaB [Anaerolineae bacterium]
MKIYLDTVGCRLNQAEIETMARQFRAAGHDIVPLANEADMAVVNTCAVTSQAAADSRGKVRQIARAGVDQILTTGCWATLEPDKALELPNVLRVFDNSQKDTLVSQALNLPAESFDLEPIAREPLPGLRQRTRAFIKVQDGCDNRCTFCITTIARGEGRSLPLADVIADIQSAIDGGAKEVVLTGVHLGSWGYELGSHLSELIKAILKHTDIPRLRLSSLEPWDLDADFFQLWQDQRLCQHLHLPLQSGCDATLKRMLRKTTRASFRDLVSAARQIMPDVAITTDVIAGFPGETEDEFAVSLEFIREMNFSGGHAFTYSPRPGTAAARLGGQNKPEVRKERNAVIREVFEDAAKVYRQKYVNKQLSVLWESNTELNDQGWLMQGLTGNYLRVKAVTPTPLWNEISLVEIQSTDEKGLRGALVSKHSDHKHGLLTTTAKD